MIRPSGVTEIGESARTHSGDVVGLSMRSRRWWGLAASVPGPGEHLPALVGLAPGVVWRGAVSAVPCRMPGAGPAACTCGFHAPLGGTGGALRRSSSVVVFGSVSVLAHGTGAAGSLAVVAIDGPLTIVVGCGGSQDGFLIEHCDRPVRWVVSAGGCVAAFCRRHLRALPAGSRRWRQPLGEFRGWVSSALSQRYGVSVATERAPV